MSDSLTEGRDPQTGRFLQGNSGNPKGRPKGNRNKLGEQFLLDLQTLWQAEGAETLRRALEEKPMDFARMVAGLLPKELLVRKAPEEDMTDAELADAIDGLSLVAAELRRRGQTHAAPETRN